MAPRVVDRPPPPPPALNPKRVIALYTKLGSIKAVARELGRGRHLIRTVLSKEEVVLRNDGTRDPKVRGLYATWRRMICRCDEPGHASYSRYGARGIGYAAAWSAFPAFRDWALNAGWREGLSLLLVDPDRDHSPANCRWGSRQEMLGLRTRTGSLSRDPVRAFGEEKSAWAWSNDPRCRLSYIGFLQRLRRGWPPEQAMTLPNRAPAPARLDPKRAVHRLGARLDWPRIEKEYLKNHSVPETAAKLRCAQSTIYLGLKERGLLVPRTTRRRSAKDRSLYGTWFRMLRACRGQDIGRRSRRVPTVVSTWTDFWAFRDWADAQGYKRGQCLVRLDPNRAYSPGNCRFVDRSDVILYAQPHRSPLGRPRYLIRALGTAKGVLDWSRDPRCSVTAATILRRLRGGWSAAEAITIPPAKPGSAGHPQRELTAFGQTKGLADWVRDRRCKVSLQGLSSRLARGVDPEAAITTPPYGLRGRSMQGRRGR